MTFLRQVDIQVTPIMDNLIELSISTQPEYEVAYGTNQSANKSIEMVINHCSGYVHKPGIISCFCQRGGTE
jgi:hypothetical protein